MKNKDIYPVYNVWAYIKNFTQPGDMVLDPFGGTGVTAIEAGMNNRRAISIDINPMAVFMVHSLIAPVNVNDLISSFQKVVEEYNKKQPKTKEEISDALIKYKHPSGIVLPKGSDVGTVELLFTDKQLAELSLLKYIIKKEKNENIRDSLMLAFSSTLNLINLTTHPSGQSDITVDSAPMRYYRYRIAPKHKDLNVIDTYTNKFRGVLNAKKDIQGSINESNIKDLQILRGSATNLKGIPDKSVDYIYTDPPYGKKIPYLDLSIMWNAWLDFDVTKEDYNQEAIEGGKYNKYKDEYNKLIAESIREMYRVLKFDRWMCFVFAHKDPEFWHLIIETAESCGFEYVGAVPQKNGQTSFKKRQHPFTVLSGQLIITFKKVNNPKVIMKANLGMNISDIIIQTIEGIVAKNNSATLEQINDELIIKGLELGFLDLLKKQYTDLTPLLLENFDFDETLQQYKLKKHAKFKAHIEVRLRIRYYLQSYLTRMGRENKEPSFDDIINNIMPLLKNGTTPENQTILKVLEDIGEHDKHKGGWRLKNTNQPSLF